MKAQGGYRFWFQKNHRVLACAFFLFIFPFFPNLPAHEPAAIKKFVEENFDPAMPGLAQHIEHLGSLGIAFELEAAISLFQQDKDIIIRGFGLEIAFDENPVHINIFGNEQTLTTTEFDIITDDTNDTNGMAIECKCLKPLDPIKNIKQLHKEQTMLLWMQSLKNDLLRKQLRMKFIFKHPGAKKKGPRIILVGPSTRNRYIMLWASWIDLAKSETPEEQFKKIINILATKTLATLYQSPIGSFAEDLDQLPDLFYADKIDMAAGSSPKTDIDLLDEQFSELSLTEPIRADSFLCLRDFFTEETTCFG